MSKAWWWLKSYGKYRWMRARGKSSEWLEMFTVSVEDSSESEDFHHFVSENPDKMRRACAHLRDQERLFNERAEWWDSLAERLRRARERIEAAL